MRRRVLFGLLDADSWSWASTKATFWFVVIILLLGYIPDRAYYFTSSPGPSTSGSCDCADQPLPA